jgi:alkylation response protein AidB-like acyl-CoA dehydrogenase
MVDKGLYARKEACMSKFHCSEVAIRATTAALHVCGGKGLLRESLVSNVFLDANVSWTPEGTNDINRLTVGRELLGLSAIT